MNSTPNSTEPTVTVRLYQIAHGRTGDKGNRSNISVIAYQPEFYDVIAAQITTEVARNVFRHRNPGDVQRYALPGLHAFNFVIDNALDGGVNDSLNLDSHGKSLAGFLLDVQLQVPSRWLAGADAEQTLLQGATRTD